MESTTLPKSEKEMESNNHYHKWHKKPCHICTVCKGRSFRCVHYNCKCKVCSCIYPVGPYIIWYSDSNPRLRTEHRQVLDLEYVLKQALSGIFEDINPELYRKYVHMNFGFVMEDEVEIRKVRHVIEIAGVNFHLKGYDKRLIDSYKELQTDLVYSNFVDSSRICKVDEVFPSLRDELLEGIPK